MEQFSRCVCKACGASSDRASPISFFHLNPKVITKDHKMHSDTGALKCLIVETYVICSSTKLQPLNMTSIALLVEVVVHTAQHS